jgi:hypothetical protein
LPSSFSGFSYDGTDSDSDSSSSDAGRITVSESVFAWDELEVRIEAVEANKAQTTTHSAFFLIKFIGGMPSLEGKNVCILTAI